MGVRTNREFSFFYMLVKSWLASRVLHGGIIKRVIDAIII